MRFFYALVLIAGLHVSLAGTVHANSKEYQKCSQYFSKYERQYLLPSRLLKAIAIQESGKWNTDYQKKMPWPWTMNVRGKGYYFESKEEAMKKFEYYRAKGIKSIDVGCMQVNMKYHGKAFRNFKQAFDPEYNIKYSAILLRKLYKQYGSWKIAVANYHAGSNISEERKARGRRYSQKVLKYWKDEIQEMINRNKVEFKRNRIKIPTVIRKPEIAKNDNIDLVQNFRTKNTPALN